METNVTNIEDVQGMFFCWTQVSRKMMKVQNLADYVLQGWLLNNVVHRVVDAHQWNEAVGSIRVKLAALNEQNGEETLAMEAVKPDDLCSGYIRIWREDSPRAIINIPVIDWRGELQLDND